MSKRNKSCLASHLDALSDKLAIVNQQVNQACARKDPDELQACLHTLSSYVLLCASSLEFDLMNDAVFANTITLLKNMMRCRIALQDDEPSLNLNSLIASIIFLESFCLQKDLSDARQTPEDQLYRLLDHQLTAHYLDEHPRDRRALYHCAQLKITLGQLFEGFTLLKSLSTVTRNGMTSAVNKQIEQLRKLIKPKKKEIQTGSFQVSTLTELLQYFETLYAYESSAVLTQNIALNKNKHPAYLHATALFYLRLGYYEPFVKILSLCKTTHNDIFTQFANHPGIHFDAIQHALTKLCYAHRVSNRFHLKTISDDLLLACIEPFLEKPAIFKPCQYIQEAQDSKHEACTQYLALGCDDIDTLCHLLSFPCSENEKSDRQRHLFDTLAHAKTIPDEHTDYDTYIVALTPPEEAMQVIERLNTQANSNTRITGGFLRDRLLGHTYNDIDLTTTLTPDTVRTLFGEQIVSAHYPTIRVKIDDVLIDITCIASNEDDSLTDTLYKNSVQRDFTINALFYCPITRELIDFHQGIQHLETQKLVLTDPSALDHLNTNPSLALRAARFNADYGFSMPDLMPTATSEQSNTIYTINAQKLERVLSTIQNTPKLIESLKTLGLFSAINNRHAFTPTPSMEYTYDT